MNLVVTLHIEVPSDYNKENIKKCFLYKEDDMKLYLEHQFKIKEINIQDEN